MVGVGAAVQVLVVQAGGMDVSASDRTFLAASGAVAIVIAWLLLHDPSGQHSQRSTVRRSPSTEAATTTAIGRNSPQASPA